MGRKSRTKGKSGELEAAKELSRLFGVECGRTAQHCGRDGQIGDVDGLEGVHVEVKRRETLSLYMAIGQAVRDCPEGDVPLVLHRQNDMPWLAVVRLDDLPELVSRLYLVLAEGA